MYSQTKCALKLHLIFTQNNWALNMVFLMLLGWCCLINSSQIAPNFFSYDTNFAPLDCRKLVQIRYHKGAGTKIYECLFGSVMRKSISKKHVFSKYS